MPITSPRRRLLPSTALAMAFAGTLIATQAQATLPAGVSCQLTPTSAKTAAQKLTERATWGQWASFDEADVQLNGLSAPEPSAKYHLLMKRPGAQPATDRPLLVFLHGFPEFSWAWEAWLQQFGSQYDSVAIDLKGYAASSRPADVAAYDITRLAHELDHVVDCLGYRKVIPIAHDWGAGLAWAYAFAHPERLQAMVIMATPHPYTYGRELAQPGSEQRQRSQYIVDIRSGKVKDPISLAAASGGGGSTLLTLPFYKGARLNRLLGSVFTPNARLNAELNYYRAIVWPTVDAFPAQPTAEALKAQGVQVPTLAFWGTADTYFSPKSWDGIQAFVPHIELHAVDGADHWLDHNRPELPAQVMDFIRRVAP
jgi:pimeloyl-ACP methyl ester carboxylesterase